ncbi:trypsin-like peptidase domain-containing protein [Candidatus Babeliales bacterium]|nr:trypsin-like peptidase domain-containing protein [Candidatus Babeliales bacterium]
MRSMYHQPNHGLKFFIILLVAATSFIGYKFYQNQNLFQNELDSLREAQIARDFESVNHKVSVMPDADKKNWIDIQKKVKDAVVQVFNQMTHFNWLEPYKTPGQVEAFGSGFFINENGDLLTNYHVVEASSGLQIQIPSLGKQQLDVEIIGVSPDRDIALLRLTEESKNIVKKNLGNIPYIELGDSDSVVRTQEILALGYPLAQQSLKSTQGIVSGREQSYIQITAPINPGSSGGPSLDADGKVIGINNAGIPSAQNVGYIIPISDVKSAINDLYKVKLLRRPILGGIFTPSTEDIISYLGNPSGGGWYVSRVLHNSLLEKVGVKSGDMIYEINGHRVDRFGDVSVGWAEEKVSVLALLNRYVVGDQIHLVVYRASERKDFRFKLKLSEIMPIRKVFPEFEKVDYEVFAGMVVMSLTLNHVLGMIQNSPDLMRFAKPGSQDKSYLIVTNILPNSATYRARIFTAGAILDEVNGERVRTLGQFRKAVLKGKDSNFITLKVDDVASESIFLVLPKDKVLNQEDELSRRFFYKVSPLVTQLKEVKNV